MNKINNILYSLLLIGLISLITGCTLPPIPKPTKDTAVIELYAQPNTSLMAETLDHKNVNDGRYFQVTPGEHRLTVLFQYDASEIMGQFWDNQNNITCLSTFYYTFKANTVYRLEAKPTMINGTQLSLKHDNKTTQLPFSSVDTSCTPD